jgi:hypothetical protein
MEKKPIPTPKERPDLYDYPDFTDRKSKTSPAYWDRVTPEHVKAAIAKRKA